MSELKRYYRMYESDHIYNSEDMPAFYLASEADAAIEASAEALKSRDEAIERLRKLLREIYISNDGEWLYSEYGEREWILRRDDLLNIPMGTRG